MVVLVHVPLLAVEEGLQVTNRILTLNDSLFQEAYTYALLGTTS